MGDRKWITDSDVLQLPLEQFVNAAGEICTSWKCPLCRKHILETSENSKNTARRNATHDCIKLENGSSPRAYACISERTQWENLNNFLTLAEKAMNDGRKSFKIGSMKSCDAFIENKIDPLGSGMLLLEKALPQAAGAITVFIGHYRLQKIMDPKTPHPFYAIMRYFLVLVASIFCVVVGVVTLHKVMNFAGSIVCEAANGFQTVMGHSSWLDNCFPMAPDGWFLPIGFACLSGKYLFFGFHTALGWL